MRQKRSVNSMNQYMPLNHSRFAPCVALAVVTLLLGAAPVQAATNGFNQTDAGPYDYNDTANWAASTINGIWDTSLTLTAGQAVTFAADTPLGTGLTFSYDGDFPLTLQASAAGTQTITLGGDIGLNTAGGTSANVTIGNSANHLNMDLGGITRTLTVAAGRTLTLVDVVSNGGITKEGSGTLTLAGANSYAGGTTISEGALATGVAAGLSTGAVVNNATLNLTSSAATTYTFGSVSGNGTINVSLGSGAATAVLGNGTWASFTGTINVGVSQAAGSGKVRLLNQPLPGTATVNVTANSTLYTGFNGAITHNAALTLGGGDIGENRGQLRFGNNGDVWAGPITLTGSITGPGDFTVGVDSTAATISGAIGESGGSQTFSKGFTGTLILSGTNTYSGATIISAGTLAVTNAGTLGGGSYAANITNNSAFIFASSAAQTLSGVISGTGSLTKDGAGTLTLSGANTYAGATTVRAGELDILDWGASALGANIVVGNASTTATLGIFGGTLAVASGKNFYVGQGADSSYIGIVNQTNGTVSFSGTPGLLIGNQRGSGTYNLSDGTLSSSASSTAFGVLLGVNANSSGTFNLSGSGVLSMPAAALAVGRNDTDGANCTVAYWQNGGTATIGNLSIGGASSLTITNINATFAITNGAFTAAKFRNFVGASSSSATLYLGGGAQVTLPAWPTKAGTANITFDFTSGYLAPYEATNGYMKAGTFDNAYLTANGLNFNVDAGYDITVAQVLQDAASEAGTLTKTGEGTLTLSGVNTHSGATTVSAGRLVGATGGSCANSAVTVASGATNGVLVQAADGSWACASLTYSAGATCVDFDFGGFTPSATTAPLQVTNALVFTGTPTVLLRNLIGVTNGIYPLVSYGSISGTPPTTFTSTYVAGSISNDTVNKVLVLVVTGGNGNSNPLLWSGGDGSWDVGTTTSWKDTNGTPGLLFFDGADVILDDSASGSSPILVTNTVTVSPASVTVSVTNKDYIISGSAIAGSAGLAKNGPGALTLSGENTYTGATTINDGTLQLGDGGETGSLSINSAISVASGATLSINRNNTVTQGAQFSSAVITGAGGFIQAGPGTTILNTTNNYTGDTAINGGVLDLSTSGAQLYNSASSVSATVTIRSNATLVVKTFGAASGTGQSLGYLAAFAPTLVIDGGTVRIDDTTGRGRGVTIGANGATLEVNTSGFSMNYNAGQENIYTDNSTLTLTGTGSATIAKAITGTGVSLVKDGSGSWSLTSSNDYSGGTTLNQGTLQANNSSALGSGSVAVASGARLVVNANNVTLANNITLNGPAANGAIYSGNRPAGNVTDLSGTITLNATSNLSTWWNDKTLRLSGNITGSGGLDFLLQPGSVGGRYHITGAANDYSGATSVTGASAGQFGFTGQAMLYLGANNALPATTALTLNYADLYLNGQSQTLPSISGSGTFTVQNGSTTPASLALGSGDTTSTFSGAIQDDGISVNNTAGSNSWTTIVGTVALTKIGNGTLTLSGTNTYSGTTTVSDGTLLVKGSIGTSTVTVQTNATLGGTGVINGPVTVYGTLAPGEGGLGQLNLMNDLTLAGDLSVGVSNSAAGYVYVAGSAVNTGAGTVWVTNLGPALVAGNSFALFNQPLSNGGAMSVQPDPGPGLVWSNRLAIDGTIQVVSVSPPPPPAVSTAAMSGNNLVMVWSGGTNRQCVLLTSTNMALDLGSWTALTTNIVGASGLYTNTIPIDPAESQRFYLLSIPY